MKSQTTPSANNNSADEPTNTNAESFYPSASDATEFEKRALFVWGYLCGNDVLPLPDFSVNDAKKTLTQTLGVIADALRIISENF